MFIDGMVFAMTDIYGIRLRTRSCCFVVIVAVSTTVEDLQSVKCHRFLLKWIFCLRSVGGVVASLAIISLHCCRSRVLSSVNAWVGTYQIE